MDYTNVGLSVGFAICIHPRCEVHFDSYQREVFLDFFAVLVGRPGLNLSTSILNMEWISPLQDVESSDLLHWGCPVH